MCQAWKVADMAMSPSSPTTCPLALPPVVDLNHIQVMVIRGGYVPWHMYSRSGGTVSCRRHDAMPGEGMVRWQCKGHCHAAMVVRTMVAPTAHPVWFVPMVRTKPR